MKSSKCLQMFANVKRWSVIDGWRSVFSKACKYAYENVCLYASGDCPTACRVYGAAQQNFHTVCHTAPHMSRNSRNCIALQGVFRVNFFAENSCARVCVCTCGDKRDGIEMCGTQYGSNYLHTFVCLYECVYVCSYCKYSSANMCSQTHGGMMECVRNGVVWELM